MSIMVDLLSDPDLKELAGVDSYLKRSYEEYHQVDDLDENETLDDEE